MSTDNLDVLAAFVAVGRKELHQGRGAARRVDVGSQPRHPRLEERLGVRLLARITRSVAPTEAGDQLLAQVGPALGDIRTALDGYAL
jgi:DNA-binding transcriptional LysR family regulator